MSSIYRSRNFICSVSPTYTIASIIQLKDPIYLKFFERGDPPTISFFCYLHFKTLQSTHSVLRLCADFTDVTAYSDIDELNDALNLSTTIYQRGKPPPSISTSNYVCKSCNYCTNNKHSYKTHIATKKHIQNVTSDSVANTSHAATTSHALTIIEQQFKELAKENEFKRSMLESMANRPTHVTVNDNRSFNINLFLNQSCADAMNIKDFIDSLPITDETLERIGTHGYVAGITQMISDGLQNLTTYQRPVHCTDVKREVIHLKDNNEWKKDDANHSITKQYLQYLTKQNLKHIEEWKRRNPGETDMFMQIVRNTMNGGENGDSNIKSVIKEISKTAAVNKKESIMDSVGV